ncbi:relaxase/mobilization nuclease domain-containing protein [Anabaena cylindrica FACHB-243]|uniref:Relaxase/mobilization nuclease family protein n=1 Tax=Anabaena cylindrica (strain ATCC 27899 / PCC 7122) TaxID=272123 RepID=K9ZS82_ANACC|nr:MULTISPECIES: relaxase/mobilization nuclease domain-containing protein [Anabaena]AFZ61392.1 Relaxase/mobilization nuclease family protein [Anabaena cylindrica PCC 7122]MBD2420389.1 relaxase/mobilization nuclease domain-containing protein [Anabaena cylindrica FACHB-243]MBY5281881.1 relaxase/mobilization nuclease domain-containing protein [Anabaena sp. CCAP 1446/1C]MBY5306970.1 relaxase/mobilization nuclease domain-containing protein [Anabaena sp. CCAP 1446/1C]MCM2405988.1 relaxase/mobilizati
MLTKVVPTGNNPGGLLRYLMDKHKEFELYGGNIAGQTYTQIIQEWRAISQQNPRTDKDTKHITMSPHHTDRLTPDDWLEIGNFMINGLGYTNNLWLMIKHKPTESQLQHNPYAPPHVHIMIHTFECENFTRINDWQDKNRAEELTREIEQRWHLYQLTKSAEIDYSAPTTGQKRRMLREQEEYDTGLRNTPPAEPTKQRLERMVIAAAENQPHIQIFIGRLQHQGVDVYPTIIGDEMKGLTFEYEGFRCRGSQLKNCSWKKLQTIRGVDYNPTRDLPFLRAMAKRPLYVLRTGSALAEPTHQKAMATPASGIAIDSAVPAAIAAGEQMQLLPEDLENHTQSVSASTQQLSDSNKSASVPNSSVSASNQNLSNHNTSASVSKQSVSSNAQSLSISPKQIKCTAMFAADIDELLLANTNCCLDKDFIAERISATEISLRRTQDQSEILRARRNSDNWEALPTESEMTPSEVHAMLALKEDLIKQSENRQQQQQAETVAPIVAALLNLKKTTRFTWEHYIAEWDGECLTLGRTGDDFPIMEAAWNREIQYWDVRSSCLSQGTTNYFVKQILPYVKSALQQQHEASIKKQRSEQKQLEL